MLQNNLWRKDIKFIGGISSFSNITVKLPKVPHVAFIGRSNVGKSSLINSLCNRTNLVKVSKTPGHTQQVNFFNMSDKLLLVDLPGYGYTKSGGLNLLPLILDYFTYVGNINSLINVLVDSRRGLKLSDMDIIDHLENCKLKWQLILTKQDKLSTKELQDLNQTTKVNLKSLKYNSKILTTSSKDKEGVVQMRANLLNTICTSTI